MRNLTSTLHLSFGYKTRVCLHDCKRFHLSPRYFWIGLEAFREATVRGGSRAERVKLALRRIGPNRQAIRIRAYQQAFREKRMHRLLSAALLCAALVFGMSGAASAQSARHVHQSGNTFHVEACAGPSAPGTARCHAHIVSDSAGNVLSDRGRNGAHMDAGVTRNVTPSGYGPNDLRSAFGITGSGSSATTIAIVDAYGYNNAAADLGVYRAQYGLPACTTANGCFKKVNQNGVQGSYPRQNTGWAQETALDLDMASAMCPGCKILLFEANSTSNTNQAAAENRAAAMGAHVISISYGGGESGSSTYV